MVTTWTTKLPQFEKMLKEDVHLIHRGVAEVMYDSIVEGSHITGAPGQPDDLRDGQWKLDNRDGPESVIGTNEKSARSVEDGISYKYGGRITLNSEIGGSHSVKLTHQNSARLIERVVQFMAARSNV